MAFGTKNLGLIKAIHVGVNPPLNTKILWYNNSNNPYTTGPAKVHYYYDVVQSEWYPLLHWMGAGNFTYIGYATDCNGAGFSLQFNEENHCYWAIVNSVTPIEESGLNAGLFANRWTKFCKCEQDSNSGNWTYFAYSNDCGESEFGTSPFYSKPCSECEMVDSYSNKTGSSSFVVNPTLDGILVEVTNAVAGHHMEIDLSIGGNDLTELLKYCVNITTVGEWNNGLFKLNLGFDEITLDQHRDTWKNTIISTSTKLHIYIPDDFVGTTSDSFWIKVGNEACCSEQTECECLKSHWAIINSDEQIETLTPEMFEGLWIPINSSCSGGCSDQCSNSIIVHTEQIEQLNQMFESFRNQAESVIKKMQDEIDDLKEQLSNCCSDSTEGINSLNRTFETFQEETTLKFETVDSEISSSNSKIENLDDKITEEGLKPIVEPIVVANMEDYDKGITSKFTSMEELIEVNKQSAHSELSESSTILNSQINSMGDGKQEQIDALDVRVSNLEKEVPAS